MPSTQGGPQMSLRKRRPARRGASDSRADFFQAGVDFPADLERFVGGPKSGCRLQGTGYRPKGTGDRVQVIDCPLRVAGSAKK